MIRLEEFFRGSRSIYGGKFTVAQDQVETEVLFTYSSEGELEVGVEGTEIKVSGGDIAVGWALVRLAGTLLFVHATIDIPSSIAMQALSPGTPEQLDRHLADVDQHEREVLGQEDHGYNVDEEAEFRAQRERERGAYRAVRKLL